MTTSSRTVVSRLTPADQAAIVAALPAHPLPGTAHNGLVSLGGRALAVTGARPATARDWEPELGAAVARRESARVGRLLPVVATGCHNDYHWVAYEVGAAKPLVAEGWRPWPARLALDVVSDVGHALDEAAASGLMPYELQPGSIFLEPRLGPLLADLGMAREVFGIALLEGDRGAAFTPPEVLNGGAAAPRSAVYLCGALLYALLTGAPPQAGPVTRWRTDLPADLDLVLARAMARDTLERYDSASELMGSARRALELDAAPVRPRPRPAPLPARPAPLPARAAAPQPIGVPIKVPPPQVAQAAYEGGEYWTEPPRYVRALRVGLPLAAALVGAVVGLQTGRPDAPAKAAGSELAADGLRITLPAGWNSGVARGDVVLAAYPASDWFSGLTVRAGEGASPARTGSDPVRIGALDFWRDTSEAPRVVRYVLPTSKGPLRLSCESAEAGGPTALAACERSISTLRLDDRRPLPLAGVAEGPGLRAPLARLRRERLSGRRALARAGAPRGQVAAARALERANTRAARVLDRRPGGAELAGLARRTAQAYGVLAASARGSRKGPWRRAAETVREREREFDAALFRDGRAG